MYPHHSHSLTEIAVALGPTLLWCVLIFSCLYVLRAPLSDLLSHATHFEAFGAKIFANTAGKEVGNHINNLVTPFPQSVPYTPHSYKLILNAPGTLYFFSHDLMLTYAGLITGARPKVLLWTLQSAMNHVPTLGLSNSPIDSTLKGIATEIKESGKKVDDETRADLAQTIWNVARRTGDEFARAQDQQLKG